MESALQIVPAISWVAGRKAGKEFKSGAWLARLWELIEPLASSSREFVGVAFSGLGSPGNVGTLNGTEIVAVGNSESLDIFVRLRLAGSLKPVKAASGGQLWAGELPTIGRGAFFAVQAPILGRQAWLFFRKRRPFEPDESGTSQRLQVQR
ncbi:MAG: hypothetical protein HQM04_13300 [Magnetococcales bacterium]|nr:hypothetical protein [Magnetococcales bacterium]MBF0116001.1 hypothetical protein [Magnetococcales bacterium]